MAKKAFDIKSAIRSNVQTTVQRSGNGRGAVIPTGDIEEKIQNHPEEAVPEWATNFAIIPVKQVEPNPDQPRQDFDTEALEELAESIRQFDVIQPITVRVMAPGNYQIISGERRWRASQLAGKETIPAYLRIADDRTLMEMALIENIQRDELNPLEIAIAYHRLMSEFGLTQEELAARVARKRSTIANILGLTKLHPEVQKALRDGLISAGHAKSFFGVDTMLQPEMLHRVIKGELSVRDTESLAKSFKPTPKTGKPNTETKASGSLPVEWERLRKSFAEEYGSPKVGIKLKGGEKGSIQFDFQSYEQLESFLERLQG